MNFLELFAGAGGLSEGFIREGFNPIGLIEKDKDACETLKTRAIYYDLKRRNNLALYREYIQGKITKQHLHSNVNDKVLCKVINCAIEEETFDTIIDDIRANLEGNKLDIMLGGPPCQVYSTIGRVNLNRNPNHPKLSLYKYYEKCLKKFRPKLFLFENVWGLLSVKRGDIFEDIKNCFTDVGYNISYDLMDCSEYGVLQKRKRVIMIGVKKDLNIEFSFDDIEKDNNKYRLSDLFEDLPDIKSNTEGFQYKKKPIGYCKNYIRNEDDVLTCHKSRFNNEVDLEIYKRVVELWNKEKKRLKYNDLPKRLQKHKNTKSFLDRYKVVADDIRYSHTIVAHLSCDGHYFIHPDIKQNRSITVREAARIQSFPDNYFFEGARTSQFKQVGNAVPPLLSRVLAKQIKKVLWS